MRTNFIGKHSNSKSNTSSILLILLSLDPNYVMALIKMKKPSNHLIFGGGAFILGGILTTCSFMHRFESIDSPLLEIYIVFSFLTVISGLKVTRWVYICEWTFINEFY